MARNTDYDLDSEFDLTMTQRDRRLEDDWDRVWNIDETNHGARRAIKPGLAVIAVGVACILIRAGWLRMAFQPARVVPSAADIHVRMPPPR